MATTHQSVLITNSCFKQPVHPSTGLPTTRDEREKDPLQGTWHFDTDSHKKCEESGISKSVNFDTPSTFQTDISKISDDEFYQKLVALKHEHKKTLELCEKLYAEKVQDRQNAHSSVQVSKDFTMIPTSHNNSNKQFDSLRREFLSSAKDRIKDMSVSKPPTGRPQTVDIPLRRSFSNSKEGLNDSVISGRSTVSGMWENFSIEDYIPQSVPRPRSASMSRLTSGQSKSVKDEENEKKKKEKEWKHKITIPKPFHMTLRDANKTTTVSRVARELDREREERARAEEIELQKKFKAKPVPAHVYMPLYDEITEQQETQRRNNKVQNKQLLLSQEKPFKFMQREEEKKQQRRTRPKSASSSYLDREDKQQTKQFKAKPFPAKLFEGSVIEKQKEEDEYRKIRIQMRSQQLFNSASLPPNMESMGKDYVDGKSRQKMYAERARKAEFTSEHKFKPETNVNMPNFDELHRQYMKEIAQRKAQREATVCRPFNLRTTGISTKVKVYEDIEKDEETLKENRWPFLNPRAKPMKATNLTKTLSTSMDAIPAQMTASAQLRASANKSKVQKKIQSELNDLEAMRKKRIREQMLKQTIKEKALANDQSGSLETQRRQKLKEFRESELARQDEYTSLLAEMKERVDKRPLLFERTAQDNARRAATKKYQATLAAAGVDEEFVERKGASASASVRSGNITDDDDLTPHHSSRHSPVRSRSPLTSKGYTDTFEPGSDADRTASEAELDAD